MSARTFLLTALLAIANAVAADAQGTTSRVLGVVTDQSAAVAPGATVTLTNDATGVAFTTVTTGGGTYAFEAVQVGSYSLAVALQGFKTFVSSGNQVNISEPTTINARLESGSLSESVQVQASSPIVQTSTSGNFGTTFEQKTIESLPIIGGRGRNVLDLVNTQPGVVAGANTGGGVHVNGARDRSWNYTLDGIDTNETSASGSNFSPLRTNPDSLAEFRVLTGNVTAELGRNSGGQVTMVTRSGTNTLAGTAYYFDRRPRYNANEWENNLIGLPKSNFTQGISGFSVGGPIVRNRTFFFANSQWLHADRTNQRTRLVYTQQARDGLWRYVRGGRNQPAGVAGASIDASGQAVAGVPVGTYNVAANDPRRTGIDPTIRGVIGLTPLPNNFTVGDGLNVAGFTWAAPEQERQNDWVVKVDHVFSGRHSAFLRVAKGYQNTNCDQVNAGEPVFPGGPCAVNTKRSPYNWAGSWRWNPASSVVNELVAGQNHFTFDFVIPSADPGRLSFSGPSFNFGSAQSLAQPQDFEVGNLRTIDTYQFVDNLSWVHGAHSVKVGTNLRFQRHTDERGSVAGVDVAPVADFSTLTNTVDPAAFGLPADINPTFDRTNLQSTINFLLGRVGSISQGFVQSGAGYAPAGTTFLFKAWFPELDFYAQDTWRPRLNLTIDAGLRWEAKLTASNPDGLLRVPSQRVAVDAPPSNALHWVPGDLYHSALHDLGPSLGVAWDPHGDGKSAVRTNYRIAYDRISTFTLSSAIFQSIPGLTTAVTNTSFGQGGGRLQDGVPALQPTAKPGDLLQPPTSANSIRVVDPNFRSPMTHEWAVSYERELWNRTLFEAAYIGRRANHLLGAYNVNQAEYRSNGFLDAFNTVVSGQESGLMNQLLGPDTRRLPGESGSQLVRRLLLPTLTPNSVALLAAQLGQRLQGGKSLAELSGLGPSFFFPYPQFLNAAGVIVIDSNDHSRYNALQLKLERRFGDSFGYFVAYTLSQSKDTRSYDPVFTLVSTGTAQAASSTPFDIHNRSLNYGPSDFDRTHVLQGQWVLELPFGNGHSLAGNAGRALDAVIGGWQVAGQLVLESGRPFTIYSGSNTFSNVVSTPATCHACTGTEGAVHDEGGVVWYLNPADRAKFGVPAAGQFSNMGRNAFRGPRFYNLNVAVSKRTRIGGRHALEVRLDATNVTNTPSFGFPTATLSSAAFGRIFNAVTSSARQVQLGVKYAF